MKRVGRGVYRTRYGYFFVTLIECERFTYRLETKHTLTVEQLTRLRGTWIDALIDEYF